MNDDGCLTWPTLVRAFPCPPERLISHIEDPGLRPRRPLGVRRQGTVIAILGALSLVACGGDGDDGVPAQEPGGAIDTRAGTYRGVGLGDDVATMEREFGSQVTAAEGERIEARSVEGKNDYGPRVIRLTPPDSASPAQELAYRYEDVVFLVRKGRIGE
jgi:hypothetical protein